MGPGPRGSLGPGPQGIPWARAPGDPLGPGPWGSLGPGHLGIPWARAPGDPLGPGPWGSLGPRPLGIPGAQAPGDPLGPQGNSMFFCLFALPYIFSFAQLCPPMFFQLLPGPMVGLGSLFSYFYFILCQVYLKLPCSKNAKVQEENPRKTQRKSCIFIVSSGNFWSKSIPKPLENPSDHFEPVSASLDHSQPILHRFYIFNCFLKKKKFKCF